MEEEVQKWRFTLVESYLYCGGAIKNRGGAEDRENYFLSVQSGDEEKRGIQRRAPQRFGETVGGGKLAERLQSVAKYWLNLLVRLRKRGSFRRVPRAATSDGANRRVELIERLQEGVHLL